MQKQIAARFVGYQPPPAPVPPVRKLLRSRDRTEFEISRAREEYAARFNAPQFAADDRPADDFFKFEIVYQSKKSNARVGRILTPHGVINTPAFVPVATNACLKGLDPVMATRMNVELMFVNTFHMLVQPGPDQVANAGGLHKFMNRTKPIITDSGGFQVFSLQHGSVFDELNMKSRGRPKKKRREGGSSGGDDDGSDGSDGDDEANARRKNLVSKVSEEGVVFQSYRDGKVIVLTPETSVDAQKKLGSDIIIPLDELLPYHISAEQLKESLHRTHRWQARSLRRHLTNRELQAMYCVVHGGMDFELRQLSIDYLTSLPFDGYAVGGSLGKDRADLISLLAYVMPQLTVRKRPIHLLGIADPESISACVPMGVDTFDSCYPTRLGRHGTLLLPGHKKTAARKSEHTRTYERGVVEGCQCHTCTNYSMAYLQHLFKAHEPVAEHLGAIHNIHQMLQDMQAHRQAILDGLL